MPQISQLRRFAVPITGTAMVAGMLLVGTPASAAISTTGFKTACVAGSIIGDVHKVTDNLITVDAPASVQPGETFTYRIQPSGTSYPDKDSGATTTNLSRLKIDYAIPSNATYVSATVVAGTSIGLDNVAPNVLRVNDSGNVDGSGGILRLSGNNQVIGNSPTTSTNSEGGIRVPKSKKNLDGSTNGNGDTWFRLPAVDVTMVAGATGVIQPKVRTAGAAGNLGASENFSTQLAKASFLGTQWAPTRCSPRENKDTTPLNAGAGPLATISIASAPVDVETATSLSVPATAITGTAVDLTATVAPNNAVGTVQFKSNGTAIGTPVTVTGGVATLSHAFDAAGAQSVTADFTAGAGFVSSSASAQTVTVSDPAPVDVVTTTSLSVPATAITGTAVDLTATVAPNTAVGTVQFKSNGTAIGTPVTVTGGVATLSHSFDVAGAQSVTADFTAGAGFVSSSAPAQTVTVSDPAPVDVETTTSLSVPATAVTGTAVDLTATVAPNNAVGTVQFKSNGAVIGSPVTVFAGTATLSHSFDVAGAQSVTADFTAGAGFVSSSASAQTVTVSDPAPVDVETTTSLSVPATAITGTAVDLTATVAPNTAVGTVQFKSNGTAIGTPVTVTGGVATLSHSFDVAGAQSVTADFTAGAGFVSSSAPAQTVTVSDPAPVDVETTTSLSVPATAITGSAVDLTATVAPNNAVGTVQFKSNGTVIGSPVTVFAGTATLSHSFDVAGAQSVTADFTAGAGFVSSSASAQTVTVSDPAPVDVETTTSLSVPATAITGTAVDLTATVAPNTAVGTVQFKSNGTAIGTPVTVTGGVATLSHSFDVAGAQSVTADFTAGAGFVSSSAPAQTVTVSDPAPVDVETTTSLSVPATAITGSAVDLTATVAPNNAVGTVQFKSNGAVIGSPVTVFAGTATLSHSFDAAGAQSVTADFTAGAGFVSSSASAQTVTVSDPAPVDVETTTALSVPATAITGTAVDLTATVAPSNAVGTVQFKSNGTAIGAPVTVTSGVATLSHAFDAAGAQSVTADFTAGAGFVSSSASAQTVTVSDPAPVDKATKTVLSVQGEAKVGLPVDLFATVSEDPSDALVPSGGTVQFKIGGVDLGAPVAVVDGVAKLPHVFGAEGTFAVSAVFSGSGVFTSSTAESVDVNVTVPTPSDVESSTSLTAPSSAKVGTAVQLKAVVSSSGATSGTVQFFDGTTPIGTAVDVVGGQAVLSHTFTTTGNHSITAVYSGAQGVTGSTSTASVVNVGNGGGGSGSLGSLSLPFGS